MSASSLQNVISQYWGYTSFRPLQREAMDAVLAGRDSIVVLPTGGGKSLCFQLPTLEVLSSDRTARALYLYPISCRIRLFLRFRSWFRF